MFQPRLAIFIAVALWAVTIGCGGTPQAEQPRNPVAAAEVEVGKSPTPENYLNLSLRYYEAGNHPSCISAANEALKRRPDYSLAYNNIAAANASMGRWDDAIQAAKEAIRLQPDLQLAKNNLAWAESGKKGAQAAKSQ